MIVLNADKIKTTSNISVTSNVVGYPVTNIQSDRKSYTWRSTDNATQTLSITWSTPIEVDTVAILNHNLTTNSNIQIKYYDTASNVTPSYDTGTSKIGNVLSAPYSYSNNATSWAYGGGNNYLKRTKPYTIQKLVIAFQSYDVDSFDVSRIVCGKSVNFTVDPESVNLIFNDQTKNIRTEAGDMITDIRPSFKELEFDMQVLDANERKNLVNIIRANGSRVPVLIDLAGNKDSDLDQTLNLYGYFDELSINLGTMYRSSTSIKINEY